MASTAAAIEEPGTRLIQLAGKCKSNPLAFAHAFWPETHPRKWQAEILAYIRDWLSNPETRYQPCRIAVASGHDIGKTALIAMIEHWALATSADCMAVTTAGSSKQLETKTVPETHRWFRRSLANHWFEMHQESIKCVESPDTWRLDFITWSKERPEPFQGLHNQGRRILLIFDEASAVDDEIWIAADGSLTDEHTEIIWLAFGNPTRHTGRFRECFGRFASRWKTFQIDSRTVEGTNKEEFSRWVEDWGEDSDYVRVKVRGEFPRSSVTEFIGHDIVAAARTYHSLGHENLPRILSCDVARQGMDQSVAILRQGRYSHILAKWRGLSTVEVAERLIGLREEHNAQHIVVDATGVGAGVADQLKIRGFKVFEYNGAERPQDPAMYANKRAECWGKMRDWLKAGAQIDNDPELEQDLCGPEYSHTAKGQILLEKKENMKSRGLASPDCADALAISFYVQVEKPRVKREHRYVIPGQQQQSWMGA